MLCRKQSQIPENTVDAFNGFCRDNGLPGSFNDGVKSILKSAGYEYAIIAYPSSKLFSKK